MQCRSCGRPDKSGECEACFPPQRKKRAVAVMDARVVRVHSGQSVPLRGYLRAWKNAKMLPPTARFKESICGWWPVTAAEVLRQFSDGLHERINRHIAGYGVGRKWNPDWQRAAIQTASMVNQPRVIVRWCPVDLRKRLAHRLTMGAE